MKKHTITISFPRPWRWVRYQLLKRKRASAARAAQRAIAAPVPRDEFVRELQLLAERLPSGDQIGDICRGIIDDMELVAEEDVRSYIHDELPEDPDVEAEVESQLRDTFPHLLREHIPNYRSLPGEEDLRNGLVQTAQELDQKLQQFRNEAPETLQEGLNLRRLFGEQLYYGSGEFNVAQAEMFIMALGRFMDRAGSARSGPLTSNIFIHARQQQDAGIQMRAWFKELLGSASFREAVATKLCDKIGADMEVSGTYTNEAVKRLVARHAPQPVGDAETLRRTLDELNEWKAQAEQVMQQMHAAFQGLGQGLRALELDPQLLESVGVVMQLDEQPDQPDTH